MFQWKEDVFVMEISQAISRTTWPNIGLFVFILMHLSRWFQIWSLYVTILSFLNIFFSKNIQCSCLLNSWGESSYLLSVWTLYFKKWMWVNQSPGTTDYRPKQRNGERWSLSSQKINWFSLKYDIVFWWFNRLKYERNIRI